MIDDLGFLIITCAKCNQPKPVSLFMPNQEVCMSCNHTLNVRFDNENKGKAGSGNTIPWAGMPRLTGTTT